MSADLGALLEGLIESGVSFILVGRLAAVIQGAPVTTMVPVEIVYKRSRENGGRLFSFLKSLQAYYLARTISLLNRKKTISKTWVMHFSLQTKARSMFSLYVENLKVIGIDFTARFNKKDGNHGSSVKKRSSGKG